MFSCQFLLASGPLYRPKHLTANSLPHFPQSSQHGQARTRSSLSIKLPFLLSRIKPTPLSNNLGASVDLQHSNLFVTSVFLLLLDGGGLDAVDFVLDVVFARVRESVGLEPSLRAGLTAGLAHITKLVEPLHVQDTLKVGTLVAVLIQKSATDVLSSLTDALPWVEGEVSGVLDGLSGDLLVVLVVEGQHASEEQIGDDTE